MRVLVSAYACEPGRGSEAGAGWEWARAAAQGHDVWLLTHATNEVPLTAALTEEPALADRLHPVFLRAPRWARPLRTHGHSRFLYYLVWQLVTCPRVARRLHRQVGFDVSHHLTYACDWAPAGASRLTGVPFVWGPVGGSSSLGSPRLWPRLGLRAALAEALRAVMLTSARLAFGRQVARRASLVLGQNTDVARVFASAPVVVEPNVALRLTPRERRIRARSPRGVPHAVFAGRILAWKGLRLALDALRRPEAAHWHLDIFGEGPERPRLERLATRWGLHDRVSFHGHRGRDEVLAAVAGADVLLLPSLHDSAGWAVAEAVTLGCPVVCLDLAGPADLISPGDGVAVRVRGDVVGALATGLEQARGFSPGGNRWWAERLPAVLADTYARAVGTQPDRVRDGS